MAILELDALSCGYGTKTVIDAVSFALNAGEILALLGHNGAGKTTTLEAIMGLLPARGGAVSLEGERVEKLPTEHLLLASAQLAHNRASSLVHDRKQALRTLTLLPRKIAVTLRCSILLRSIAPSRARLNALDEVRRKPDRGFIEHQAARSVYGSAHA